MPANRSRTLEWRRCLQQIRDRNGAIEIAVARHYNSDEPRRLDLVWRVRVLEITDGEIIIEQPIALGHEIRLEQGIEIIAILSVGQNRWTFRTTNLGAIPFRLNAHRSLRALRLLMPESVERCQRRNYYRFGTSGIGLPAISAWPLLDPKTVVLAERANEISIHAERSEHASEGDDPLSQPLDPASVMPEVGPMFRATLLNIGGGGIGLLVEPQDAHVIGRHKLLWLQISLEPDLKTPICATGKIVHAHMESSQQTYVGVAFDFSFNPSHQRFVVDQICRYIALQQREQLARQRNADGLRQSA